MLWHTSCPPSASHRLVLSFTLEWERKIPSENWPGHSLQLLATLLLALYWLKSESTTTMISTMAEPVALTVLPLFAGT